MPQIILPDGKKISYSNAINGFEIAKKISKSLAKEACIMNVDGVLKDLSYSINKDVNKLFSDGQIGLLVDFTKELDYLKIMNSLNKLKTRSSRSINCRNVAEDIFSL